MTNRRHRAHRRRDTTPASTSLASTIADAIAPTFADIDDSLDRLAASLSGPVRNDIDTNRARLDKLLADLSDHFHRLGADIAELDARLKTLEPDDD